MSAAELQRAWIGRAIRLLPVVVLILLGWDLFGWEPATPRYEGVPESERFFYDSGRGHHLIGLVVCAWMLWRRFPLLVGARADPGGASSVWGALLFLPAIALRGWAAHTQAGDLQLVALALAVVAAGVTLEGGQGARRALAPALALLLSAPLPTAAVNRLIYPMQRMTAIGVASLLDLLGVDHQLLAEQIRTAGHIFYVIEGCAGLGTLQSILLVTLVYLECLPRGRGQVLLLTLAAPLVATIVNQLRVLMIVLLPDSDLARDHATQGLMMLVLGVVGLALIDLVAERVGPARAERPDSSSSAPRRPAPVRLVLLGLFLVGYLASGALVPRWVPPDESLPRAASLPLRIGEWRARQTLQPDREFLGSVAWSDHVYRRYVRSPAADGEPEDEIEAMVLVDDRRDRSRGLLSRKVLLADPARVVLREESLDLDLASGPRRARLLELDSPRGRTLVLHWWVTADRPSTETLRALAGLDQSRWHRPAPLLSVRLALSGAQDRESGVALLEGFAASLDAALREVGLATARPRSVPDEWSAHAKRG